LREGQFASVDVMHEAAKKVLSRPNQAGVILCERGTSFGPDNLVVDFRNLITLKSPNSLTAFDATHAAQRPAIRAREGKGSDGDLYAVRTLARAAVACGVDGLFLEVHEHPAIAPVDSKIQLPLSEAYHVIRELKDIANASHGKQLDPTKSV